MIFWIELSMALGCIALSQLALQFALIARFQRIDHLTNIAIADILNYMLSGESGDEPMKDPGYTAPEVESLRAR